MTNEKIMVLVIVLAMVILAINVVGTLLFIRRANKDVEAAHNAAEAARKEGLESLRDALSNNLNPK
jgi:uncharacterized protein YpmB